jgi:hypothetical protein
MTMMALGFTQRLVSDTWLHRRANRLDLIGDLESQV